MTQDEIIRMAREAGFEGLIEKAWGIEQLERYAALVAANEREKHLNLANEVAWSIALAEREACAKVCEEIDVAAFGSNRPAPNDCAAAIRARGENGTA